MVHLETQGQAWVQLETLEPYGGGQLKSLGDSGCTCSLGVHTGAIGDTGAHRDVLETEWDTGQNRVHFGIKGCRECIWRHTGTLEDTGAHRTYLETQTALRCTWRHRGTQETLGA